MGEQPTAYMSRLQLDPVAAAARRALTSVDAMHKATCQIVGTDRASGRILWRWEPEPVPTILLQTSNPPDRERLPEGFILTDPPVEMAAHLDRLKTGMAIRYRVTVSPTRNTRVNGRHKTKQTPVPATEIPSWWKQKAVAAGLETETEHSVTKSNTKIKKAGIPVVRIDGYALIQNPDHLRTAILNGIGRGKPYGCGLLTVQPLQR